MSPTKDRQKQRRVIVVHSRASSLGEPEITLGEEIGVTQGQETELVAQITIPRDKRWAWLVVFTSLITIAIIDGLAFTFGAMYADLTEDIQSTSSSVGFINSFAQATYYMLSPVVSAFIDRFGFKAAGMTGSIFASFGLLCTYFSMSYSSIFFFYGFMVGAGFCFVNMASLIVGFYFERLRALALSISTCGSSIGISMFYPINSYLVKLAGWRVMILLHAGLNGLSFFLCMTYRPVISEVAQKVITKNDHEDDEESRTINYLSLKHIQDKTSDTTRKEVNYPTASEVVNIHSNTSIAQPRTSVASNPPHALESTVTDETASGGGMDTLQKRVPQSRRTNRDDEGKLKDQPAYKNSLLDTKPESADIQERRGILYTMAARRVLSAMVLPKLLKQKSFLLVSFSGLFLYVGFSIPYIFLEERNRGYGLDPDHCSLFISVLGFMNILGKIVVGAIACKVDPIKVFIVVNILSGVSTILSDISRTLFFQYFYSGFYGFFMSSMPVLRSMTLVKICGLENLTNASGLSLIFQGLGCFISTPSASEIRAHFGVHVAFIWAGSCMILSGLLLMPVEYLANKERNEALTYIT